MVIVMVVYNCRDFFFVLQPISEAALASVLGSAWSAPVNSSISLLVAIFLGEEKLENEGRRKHPATKKRAINYFPFH